MALALTAGQTHDSMMAEPMLADLKPGAILLADKAYNTNALRALAESRKAWANIPAKRTRKCQDGARQGMFRNPDQRHFAQGLHETPIRRQRPLPRQG